MLTFKKIWWRFLLLMVVAFVLNLKSFGQGCSDAGACTIDISGLSDSVENKQQKITLNVDQSFALGEKFVFISQTTLSFQYNITPNTRAELRVPYLFYDGNLGYNFGVGDIIVSLSQNIVTDKYYQITGSIGSRLKVNNADAWFNDLPLPMAYQTSLGTYDLIAGMQYARRKWNVYAAYQHPFGRNENQYLVPADQTDPNKQYFESAYLKRGDDLYARFRYDLILKKESFFTFTLLSIYRIQKSQIMKNDQTVILDGSNGLTLNIGATYTKNIKKDRQLSFQLAFPVIDRDYRADGLTRNIILFVRISNL